MAQSANLELDLTPLLALKKSTKAKGALLKAVRAAAKVVQPAVKARVRRASGLAKQSIGTKSAKGRKIVAFSLVGARTKVQKRVKRKGSYGSVLAQPARYLHILEKGAKAHSIKRGGRGKAAKHPGARPKPFLAPAFAATVNQAIEAARGVIEAEVAKALAKG